jgi:hypothetical protein
MGIYYAGGAHKEVKSSWFKKFHAKRAKESKTRKENTSVQLPVLPASVVQFSNFQITPFSN